MTVSIDLTGRKAIVTGATRGLGQSMAEALMQAGAEVVITGTSNSVQDSACKHSEAGYLCHGVQADFSDASGATTIFDAALDKLGGRVDILVTAAGIQRRAPAEEFPLDDWAAVLQVNLTSVFQLCQLAGQKMLEQGGGKIINVASLLSFFGGFTVPAYAASKGGVAQLTKALSNEWAGRGINVNAIAPGYMATEMNTALLNDAGRNAEISARIPAGRWGQGEDMKGATLFLASNLSDYVNGAIIPVDGGYLSK
ncbi:SDR family oxidoreductase [Paracoccus sp. Z330]|uniref:SDR family oxidoreductase n=1 Tax=Paracoccus onchidii TaxID=3017813 RepID=A0ABT4ZG92_9RHOB|nr:SDR family oxidoreductase [Paracoccus onchidii]MDB6178378.1 SDR family oxidoreductase [Paracoccus onchidii]